MNSARLPIATGAGAKGFENSKDAQTIAHNALPQASSLRPCRIETFGGGRFQFAPHGIEAVCGDVRDADDNAIDIVAWVPGEPSTWFLQRGVAVIAGEDALLRNELFGWPVFLVPTPAAWRAARERKNPQSVVVLDPRGDWERILSLASPLHATPALKWQLDKLQREKLLRHPLPLDIEPITDVTAAEIMAACLRNLSRAA